MRVTVAKFHQLSMFCYFFFRTFSPLIYRVWSIKTSVSTDFPFSCFSRAHSVHSDLHVYKLLKSLVEHPKRLKHLKTLEFKITHCKCTVTKLVNVERERAIGMLKANVTPLIVAQQFRCHVRTIGRLKNRFQKFGTTSNRLHPGRRRVSTRRKNRDIQTSHLCNRFHLESVIARTPQGIHNPKLRAQTLRNRFKRFA